MISYDADLRHAEIIVEEIGLGDSKPLPTFVVKDEVDVEDHLKAPLLGFADATPYKSLVARANGSAADRPGIQHACKEFSSSLANPRAHDWEKWQRFGKFAKGKPRLVHRYWRIPSTQAAIVHTDANWAGDRRHSTSRPGERVAIVGR